MFTSARKTVSSLKQTFEANANTDSSPRSSSPNHQHYYKQDRHKTNFPANMISQKKLAKAQEAVQPSIDTIIDTATSLAPASLRPSASKHPSWVGPKPHERPSTPGTIRMEYPVTIEFYLPGTQPPVYIATDLSQPQWRPVEMDYTQDEDGEYRFSMEFEAEEGEYQYKLRLGPGDWWICDDSVPKVKDDAGNENNLAVVKRSQRVDISNYADGDDVDVKAAQRQDSHQEDAAHPAPLMSHELSPDHARSAQHHEPLTHKHSQQNLHEPEAHSPLFRHESLAPPTSDDDDPDEDDENETSEMESSPLLRHESIAPASQEYQQSPMFRHESIAIDDQRHHDISRNHSSPHLGGRKHSNDSIPEEADPNDPTLEKFPTDHAGIMESLGRTRKSMQEDETSEGRGSPRRQSPSGSVVAPSPSLPSVREDDGEEELEELREEETAAAKPEEPDPNADVPQVMISEPQERPFAPMTPPMTPKDEQESEEEQKNEETSTEETDDLSTSVQEKVQKISKKAHHKAKQAAHTSLPALAVGLAVAMAAASAAIAIWYIKTKSDNVVL